MKMLSNYFGDSSVVKYSLILLKVNKNNVK